MMASSAPGLPESVTADSSQGCGCQSFLYVMLYAVVIVFHIAIVGMCIDAVSLATQPPAHHRDLALLNLASPATQPR